MTGADEIKALLAPLFERAEREGLWFFSAYQSLWFSPRELRAEHAKDCFLWGPANWQLRLPSEYIAEGLHERKNAEEMLKRRFEHVEKETKRG